MGFPQDPALPSFADPCPLAFLLAQKCLNENSLNENNISVSTIV